MDRFRADTTVVDVCVEDPNDDFQSLRDVVDLKDALLNWTVKNWSDFTKPKIKELQKKYKLSKLQVVRVVEMYALKSIPKWNTNELAKVRIWIKKRIFEKNKSVLTDMSMHERIKAIEDAYQRVLEDYEEIISRV
jgi:histone acetyltransferase 1